MSNVQQKSSRAPLRDRSSATYLWAAGSAGIGALIGHAIDRRGGGAAIGGAVGGLLGGYLGSLMDDSAGR